MSAGHTTGAARALYRVFVLPNLAPRRQQTVAATPSRTCSPTTPLQSFSTTAARAAKTRPPEIRREKWNEEINSKIIYIVDPATNTLDTQPHTRFDILKNLNLDTHRLVQVDEDHQGLPVCKVVNKKQQFERAKRIKEQAKERKKVTSAAHSLKTLELNWAMDPNDLGHRLDKMAEFLGEGRKVEVVLASKKRGRKASEEECEEVVRKIRSTVDGVAGAKEAKEMEGKVGGFVTLLFHGRPLQYVPSQTAGTSGVESSA